MFRHILSYMSKFTRILFHLTVLCDSLKCGAYGTYCYIAISAISAISAIYGIS